MKDRVLMGPTLFERQAKVGGDIFYSCNEQAYLDIPKILITNLVGQLHAKLQNFETLQDLFSKPHIQVVKVTTSFQLNAKQNAEKRYHEVLKKEGLQEQELVRLTKPIQKRRRVKTLSVPRKKSSKESAGMDSEWST